ncbi:hypothetical protein OIU84_002049 [Salix udensis]|uniref:Uncharacterized protein n=1 Tax=Salix udensis TaxID=889485 RepID=A0AAD6KAM4_9ROSI|nr:hypothetical protein OIU84_002049 [Salix udensis]
MVPWRPLIEKIMARRFIRREVIDSACDPSQTLRVRAQARSQAMTLLLGMLLNRIAQVGVVEDMGTMISGV